ncbi:hypothetical protein [Fodinicurvata sp. EGI_FJ10296]|uniref:hypothetical protein n=1 Tax=Fodinicurvata sp. EGI_FJ10296 TaxID=3231908 RepID=UPI00345254D4
MVKCASIFAALVSALAMTTANPPPAQATTPCCAVDDDTAAKGTQPDTGPDFGDTLPPLHIPTLVGALEDIGLVDPVLVGQDPAAATLTFAASRPDQTVPQQSMTVFIDVDITTGLLIERSA